MVLFFYFQGRLPPLIEVYRLAAVPAFRQDYLQADPSRHAGVEYAALRRQLRSPARP